MKKPQSVPYTTHQPLDNYERQFDVDAAGPCLKDGERAVIGIGGSTVADFNQHVPSSSATKRFSLNKMQLLEVLPVAVLSFNANRYCRRANAAARRLLFPFDPLGLSMEIILTQGPMTRHADPSDLPATDFSHADGRLFRCLTTMLAPKGVCLTFTEIPPCHLCVKHPRGQGRPSENDEDPGYDTSGLIARGEQRSDETSLLDLLRLRLAQQEQQQRLHDEALRRAEDEVIQLSGELAWTRKQAKASSQAKSRFLGSMSHELRTPLHGILGYAQLLHLEGDLNSVQDARIDAMLAAGKHLLQMINKVLDLSQIEEHDIALHQTDFDLHAAAGTCLDVVKPACIVKRLDIGLAIASDVPRRIVADSTRLQQILMNLLGNAVKFTAQGAIELRLLTLIRAGSASPRILRIEVADTGTGIPLDHCRRLFKEFARLEAAVVEKVEGSGLGLALSVRLANAMGGKLGHKDNPGGGSIFWLELPLSSEQAEAAQGVAVEDLAVPERALRALVVDDIAMNCEIASAFLRSVGHEVVCAQGGTEAVAAARAEDFDVVLMDVCMPDVDGLEATRRIRAIEGRRGQVPIVALTAQALIKQVAEFEKAGMDGHLVKPYAPETLIAVAEKAAKSGRLHGRAPACDGPEGDQMIFGTRAEPNQKRSRPVSVDTSSSKLLGLTR